MIKKLFIFLCIFLLSIPISLRGQSDTLFVENIKLGLMTQDLSFSPLYISTREFHDLISLQSSWTKNQRDQSLMEVNDNYSKWKSTFAEEMKFIQEDFTATQTEEEMTLVWEEGYKIEKNSDLWFTSYFTIQGEWVDPKNRKYPVVFEFLAMNFEGKWKLMSSTKEINP